MSHRPTTGRRIAAGHGLPLLSLLIGLLSACGPAPVKWSVAAGEAPPFEQTRAAFTRTADVYEFTDGRLFARATWFSPRFAAALAGWQGERAGLDAAARTAAVEAAVTKAQVETWVFLALTTGDPEWNDLDEATSSLKVWLNVDGTRHAPVAVDRLSLDEMADRKVVFPYADDLTVGYDVVFPKLTDPKRVRLEVVGIPGRAELRWDIDRGGSAE